MNLIGDVRGKVAVLVDDMIDTAGTITNAAKVGMLACLCITTVMLVPLTRSFDQHLDVAHQ